MTRKPSKLYSHHVSNLRELEHAATQVSRLARSSIASRDPQHGLRTLLRLYAFLIGAWLECRLKKLLHEEFGFEDADRDEILQLSTQIEQWQATVDSAFRKHHKIKSAPLNARVLGVAHAARREALQKILDEELRLIIEIRNKLAHGQWIYPLNSQGTKVESDKYKLLNSENLQSLQYKFDLAAHLAGLVHDLVVSKTTFERDFESHYKKLSQAKSNLAARSYEKYAEALVTRRQRARQARTSEGRTGQTNASVASD